MFAGQAAIFSLPKITLRPLLLKPAFRWNHDWAMRRGEESLGLELARRRAAADADRAAVPAPPGPTFLGPRRRARLGLA